MKGKIFPDRSDRPENDPPVALTFRAESAVALRNRGRDTALGWTARLGAGAGVVLLVAIIVLLSIRAWPAAREFGPGFLFNSNWNPITDQYGALALVYGTVVSSFLALLLAAPLGVGVAIFLTEDHLPLKLRTLCQFLVELLAAIPSVIYGLWGVAVVIPLTTPLGLWLYQHCHGVFLFSTPSYGPGMLPAALVLAIMVLPTIAALSRNALHNVSRPLKECAYALGASRWDVLLDVSLPAARGGIFGAVILALGRAMGETMALAMLIGNSNRISASILAPANTIASLLANSFGEASGMQLSALMYLSLVLMLLTLLVNIGAQTLLGGKQPSRA